MKSVAMSLMIVLCTITAVNAELIFKQDFENGLADWTPGFDLPDDPNNPGNIVAWEVVPSDEQVFAGDRSLKLFIDGRQDDGTVWLAGEFPSYPTQNTDVTVNFGNYIEKCPSPLDFPRFRHYIVSSQEEMLNEPTCSRTFPPQRRYPSRVVPPVPR